MVTDTVAGAHLDGPASAVEPATFKRDSLWAATDNSASGLTQLKFSFSLSSPSSGRSVVGRIEAPTETALPTYRTSGGRGLHVPALILLRTCSAAIRKGLLRGFEGDAAACVATIAQGALLPICEWASHEMLARAPAPPPRRA
jgi:hypothetical protein